MKKCLIDQLIQLPIIYSASLEKSEFRVANNGIIYIHYKENCLVSFEDSLLEFHLLKDISAKSTVSLIIILEPLVRFSDESQKFWIEGPGSELIRSEAVVCPELATKLMLMRSKLLYAPFKYDVNIFKTIEQAEEWILSKSN